MDQSVSFQIVCSSCCCLEIKIENPEQAPREASVYCGGCGVSRGTIGALRDLSVRPGAHAVLPTMQRAPGSNIHSELVARHNQMQSLRRKAPLVELRQKS
jgi:hypothetical protein